MTTLQGDDHTSPGDIMRRLRQVERRQAMAAAERRLEAASIGAGGLRVKDGGAITILDGDGEPALTLSADEGLKLAGLLQMLADANIETYDAEDRLRLEIGNVIFVHGIDGEQVEVNDDGIVLHDPAGQVVGIHQSTGFMAAYAGTADRAIDVTDAEVVVRFPDGTIAQRVEDDRWAVAYPDLGGAGTAVEVDAELAVSGPGTRGVVIRVTEADGLRFAVDTDADGIQSGQVTAGPADSAGAGFRTLRIPN